MGSVENKGHSIPVCHLGHRAQRHQHSLGLRLCNFSCFSSVFTPSSVWLFLLRFFASPLLALFCICGVFWCCPAFFCLLYFELDSEFAPDSDVCRFHRGLVHQAECSSNLLVTQATTTAKGLFHRLPPQVHSLRHRRRRGTYSALAEDSATTAIRLYVAFASAYLLSEVPLLVSLRLRFHFWFHEGDGTCLPRPPVCIPRHHTPRGPQCC